MININDLEAIRRRDPEQMLERIREFPQQVRDAWENVSRWKVDKVNLEDIDAVLVLGMGGSAIGADLVAGLLAKELPVPLLVHRGYDLPGWVDDRSVVIASSYSGGTEETLSGWQAAGAKGAHRLAITTGGELGRQAREAGTPVLSFQYDSQPRAALGHSFTLVLGALWKLGLIADPTKRVQRAVERLQEVQDGWQPEVPEARNQAKRIASWWYGRIPVFFGAEHLAVIARRWATQTNENAKSWAVWADMPELNHNIVVGFENPRVMRENARVVCLRSRHYHERNTTRFDVTTQLLEQVGVEYMQVEAPGGDRLAELLWMNLLGDYASFYLAMLNDADPTPVEPIARLKARLAEF